MDGIHIRLRKDLRRTGGGGCCYCYYYHYYYFGIHFRPNPLYETRVRDVGEEQRQGAWDLGDGHRDGHEGLVVRPQRTAARRD